MTISLKHSKVSAKSDGPDSSLVLPSDWNAEHSLSMATGKFLGRTTSGTGTFEELDITWLYERVSVMLSDMTTALTTGTAKALWRPTFAGNIMSVRACVATAQTSGSLLTFNVRKNGTSIFTTKPTLDNTEKTTQTAATASVLTSTPLSFADDDEFLFDIDQIGDVTAKGAMITMLLRFY